MLFDEHTLRDEIIATWGAHGAHIDVYDMILARLRHVEERLAALHDADTLLEQRS